jgi:hypothetical protein
MGQPQHFEQQDITRVTHQLEQSPSGVDNLRTFLAGRTENERIEALDAIRAQNARDRLDPANANLPKIDFTLDMNTQGYNGEKVTVGGKDVLESRLDLNTLQRTDSVNGKLLPPESALSDPANPDFVRNLTTLYEQGNGQQAWQQLAALPEEQRIQAVKAMEDLNAKDLKAGTTNVTLAATIGIDKSGNDYIRIQRGLPNFGDRWNGGDFVLDDTYNPVTGKDQAVASDDHRTK